MTIAQECDPNKIKDSLPFQTRIKLGDEFNAQVVPLQFQSNRPPYLASVKLGLEEEAQQPKPQQSFLSRYVRYHFSQFFPSLLTLTLRSGTSSSSSWSSHC